MPVKDLLSGDSIQEQEQVLDRDTQSSDRKRAVYREGNPKSPTAVIKLKKKAKNEAMIMLECRCEKYWDKWSLKFQLKVLI